MYVEVELGQMKGMCPTCSTHVEFEVALVDTVTGQKGPACPECDTVFTSSQLDSLQEKMFGRPSQML